jgi:hypothetical protein
MKTKCLERLELQIKLAFGYNQKSSITLNPKERTGQYL